MSRVAIAVCDGSYKEAHGTAALVIEGETSENRFLGVNVTPGLPEDQSPYRAELGGIFGAIVTVRCICTLHSVTTGSIVLHCDCDNALKRLFTPHSRLKPKMPHYDILSAIRFEIEASPLQWSCCHVYGHQDDHRSNLSREEQLNVEMDNLAKAYWTHTAGHRANPQQRIKGEAWPLWIDGKKITGNFEPAVIDYAGGVCIRAHWEITQWFPHDTIHNIDWDACYKSNESLKNQQTNLGF